MKMLHPYILAASCLLLALPRDTEAQMTTNALLFCPKLNAEITVDGVLDEPVWKHAPVVHLARAGNLSPLLPANARVFWDERNLYVGFEVHDIDIRSELTERDSLVWRDGDVVEFFLAPDKGAVTRFELQLNPLNAQLDIAWREGKSFDECKAWNWPGIQWKTHVDGTLNDTALDKCWTAELALPWEALVEAGASAPAPGLTHSVLFYVMNRVALANGRAPRESTYWPVLRTETTADPSLYGRMTLIDPSPPDLPVNGFAEVVQGTPAYGDALAKTYRGMAPTWSVARVDDIELLSWKTHPVPAAAKEKVSFWFGITTYGAKGYAPDQFGLYLNGKKLLSFDPHRPESHTWAKGTVHLTFHHRSGSAHANGVIELQVPVKLVEAGKAATLEVRPESEKKTCSFALLEWTDAAWYEHFSSAAKRGQP